MRLLTYPELLLLMVPVVAVCVVPLCRDAHHPRSRIAKEVYGMGGGDAAHVPVGHLQSWFASHPQFAAHVGEECAQVPDASISEDGKLCAAAGYAAGLK